MHDGLAGRRQQFGAGVGHDRVSPADEPDAALADAHPNCLVIAQDLELGADVFDRSRVRNDAQRSAGGGSRRDIEVDQPALQ